MQLKSHHARFLCAEPSGKAVADRREAKEWETWTMVTANGKATFKSAHGKYLCAEVPPTTTPTSTTHSVAPFLSLVGELTNHVP